MKIGIARVSAVLFSTLVFGAVASAICPPTLVGLEKAPRKGESATTTMDADRLRGIKAAAVDLEADKLKIRSAALPVAAWHDSYLDVLQKECGIEWETVAEQTGKVGIELRGYNDVMIMEIEHRFGKGILETLQKKAEASFRKTTDG